MRGKARSLIGLKHTIGERILLRHLEIRHHFRRVYIPELSIGGKRITSGGMVSAHYRDLIGSIHLSAVIHVDEGSVRVIQVVSTGQGYGGQLDRLPMGIQSAIGDVSIRQTMKEIIRRAVFLKDYDHVMSLRRIRRGSTRGQARKEKRGTDHTAPCQPPCGPGHGALLSRLHLRPMRCVAQAQRC